MLRSGLPPQKAFQRDHRPWGKIREAGGQGQALELRRQLELSLVPESQRPEDEAAPLVKTPAKSHHPRCSRDLLLPHRPLPVHLLSACFPGPTLAMPPALTARSVLLTAAQGATSVCLTSRGPSHGPNQGQGENESASQPGNYILCFASQSASGVAQISPASSSCPALAKALGCGDEEGGLGPSPLQPLQRAQTDRRVLQVPA